MKTLEPLPPRPVFPTTTLCLAAVVVCLVGPTPGESAQPASVFDVRSFGAVGDGVTLDTAPIQKAVDACAEAGGGKIYLQGGTFLSGTIRLKSNVTLHVEAGATLLGSADFGQTLKRAVGDFWGQLHGVSLGMVSSGC